MKALCVPVKPEIIIVTNFGLAYFTPDETKQLWCVDLPQQGKRFFMHLNTPLLRIVAELAEVGRVLA